MRLRVEYSRETDLIFSDNIPAYADWLEKRLALRQPLVSGSLPIRYCQQCGEPLRRNKHKTWCEYSSNDR
jgi:hypothetical protein